MPKRKRDNVVFHSLMPASKKIDSANKPVLVKVGQWLLVKEYHVDGGLLSANSPFFDSALKKEWPCGRERTVTLSQEDSASFNSWLDWIYTRRLPLDIESDRTRREHDSFGPLIHAYAFGNQLMDQEFKDAVFDALLVVMQTQNAGDTSMILPGEHTRKLLYSETAPDSKLRKLLVHRVATCSNTCTFLHEDDDGKYLYDVAQLQSKNRGEEEQETTLAAAARCEFHEHKQEEVCYRTKYKVPFAFRF